MRLTLPLGLYAMRARQKLDQMLAQAAQAKTRDQVESAAQAALAELHNTAFKPSFQGLSLEADKARSPEPLFRAAHNAGNDLTAILYAEDELGDTLVNYFNHTHAVTKQQDMQIRQIEAKVDDLALITKGSAGTLTYHNEFQSLDWFDPDMVQGARAHVSTQEGVLTLARTSVNDLSKRSKMLNVSTNGDAGNYQLVEAKQFSYPDDSFTSYYSYISDQNPHDDPAAILDARSDTWFECQMVNVRDEDKEAAGGFGFEWSKGRQVGDILRLRLTAELPETTEINWIAILPYMPDQAHNMPTVRRIMTSTDGIEFDSIYPELEDLNFEIGAYNELSAAFDNKAAKSGVWTFNGRKARYVDLILEQKIAYSTQLGATAYYRGNTGNPGSLTLISEDEVPDIIRGNPPGRYRVSDTMFIDKNIESYNGWRYAIGIRDIYIGNYLFARKSEFVSQPYTVDEGIKQLTLESKEHLPLQLTGNLATRYDYIQYFISFNDSGKWHQISPLHHQALGDETIPPKTVVINSRLPKELHEPFKTYLDIDNKAYQARLKIVLTRPDNTPTVTPLVDSYALRIRPEEGDNE